MSGDLIQLQPSEDIDPPDATTASNTPIASSSVLARGVLWLGAARWSSQAIAWVVTLYMARILTDREYGAAGLVAVATSWVFALTELGLGTAMLALRDDAKRDASMLHSLVAATTLLGSVMIAAGAIPAAAFVHDAALAPLLAVGGLLVFVQGLSVVPLAMLQLRLDYRAVARVEFARAVTNTFGVAAFAFAGFRVWSLPLASIAASFVQLLLVARASRIRMIRPQWESIRELIKYGRYVLVSRMAWNTYVNADIVMVGRALSTGIAGQYQFAWNMATLPGEKLVNVVQAVMAPFFSALADNTPALRRYFLLITEGLAVVVFPVFLGIVAVADEAIPLIFGDKWRPAVLPLRLLIVYAMMQGVNSVVTHAATALRLARQTNYVNVVALIVLPPCFYVAAKLWGLPAVAMVWIVASPCMAALPLRLVLSRLQIRFTEYAAVLAAPVSASIGMWLAVELTRRYVPRPAHPGLALALDVAAGALAYPTVLLLAFPAHVARVKEMIQAVRAKKPDA
jgi:teichuronic acid exporter